MFHRFPDSLMSSCRNLTEPSPPLSDHGGTAASFLLRIEMDKWREEEEETRDSEDKYAVVFLLTELATLFPKIYALR